MHIYEKLYPPPRSEVSHGQNEVPSGAEKCNEKEEGPNG